MKKLLPLLLIFVLITFTACDLKNGIDLKHTTSINKNDSELSRDNDFKNINVILKEVIIEDIKKTDVVTEKIELYKIKKYKDGYLVLVMQQGEGAGISVYYLVKADGDKYIVKGIASSELALSMGFGINRFVIDNDTVLFSNLNESTWVPENDTRKETKYTRIVIYFDNGKTLEEKVDNKKGYIAILNGIVNVIDMKLYNAKNDLVGSYKDIGSSTTEVSYRIKNSK